MHRHAVMIGRMKVSLDIDDYHLYINDWFCKLCADSIEWCYTQGLDVRYNRSTYDLPVRGYMIVSWDAEFQSAEDKAMFLMCNDVDKQDLVKECLQQETEQ